MPGPDAQEDPKSTPSSGTPSSGTRSSGSAPAAGLEAELKQVMDAAVARVAQIETAAVVEAREIVARSEHEARAAFSSTLDRTDQLVSKLETLAGSVDQMSLALRAEVDEVTARLRQMRDGLGDWPEGERAPAPTGARLTEEEPADAAAVGGDDPHAESSPELAEVFRDQITRMRDDGRSRDEAERVLLRFRLGHRFVYMLDEVYSSAPEMGARKPGLIGKLRSRP